MTQSGNASNSASIMAVATPADYARDPVRWGSAEVASHFPGFQHLDMRTSGAIIRLRHGGSGPPLLLVHGNPQNHTSWYKVAATLAQRYHVILPDLRGYGRTTGWSADYDDDLHPFCILNAVRDALALVFAFGHAKVSTSLVPESEM